MRRLILLLLCSFAWGQTYHDAVRENTNIFTKQNTFELGTIQGPIVFANLGTVTASPGAMVVITDASAGSVPCSGGGTGALAVYVAGAWNCTGLGGSGSQIKGHPAGQSATQGLAPLNNYIAISSYCAPVAFVNCPLFSDVSHAFQQINADLGGAGSPMVHIVDDLCGIQYFTEQPFTGMTGIAEFSANCPQSTVTQPNMILVDYPLATVEIPTNFHVIGQGLNSNAQTPDGSYLGACNPVIDVCPGGGWNHASNAGILNSASVSSNVMTMNLTGTFSVGSQLNSIQPGRLLHVYGCTNTTNNAAWVVAPLGVSIASFTGGSGTLVFTTSGPNNGYAVTNQVRINGFTANQNQNLNGQVVTITATNGTTSFSGAVTGSGYNGAGATGYANEVSPNYIFPVYVPSSVTSTASNCGAEVFLDQPLVALGVGGGTTEYGSSISNFNIDCRDEPACGGLVEADGEEGVGTEGDIQVFNATDYYYRWDQSIGTYGSQNSGDTNSMGSGALQGNNDPLYCSLAGGCACNGGSSGCSSNTPGVAGTVPQGTVMACGAGTTKATISAFSLGNGSQDACQNTNFVGFLDTGAINTQGPGRFKGHMTMSISDKSGGSGTPIAGFAGTIGTASQASAYGIFGATGQFDHLHGEYFNIDVDVCGDEGTQYTWAKFYDGIITATVRLDGGFHAFNSGGIGLDVGTAGKQAFCQDIYAMMNAGLGGGNGYVNNITASGCPDATFTIWMGHATSPAVPQENSSCSTGNVQTIGGNGAGIKIGVATNTDNGGTLSFSGGTTSTSYTFKGSYANAPVCVGFPSSDPGSGNRIWISTLSATTLTFSSSNNLTTTIRYVCWPTS